jgi:hypothetical protein
MRLGIVRSAIITFALTMASVAPLFAQNQPDTSLSGAINGRELCEERVCGSAIFAAVFAGQIDGRPAVGLALGSIRHYLPLPQPGESCVPIFGGSWSISTLRRTLAGDVDDEGGTICPIDGTHFQIDLTMNITQGGKGSAHLTVFLDHSPLPLPPIITGSITQ